MRTHSRRSLLAGACALAISGLAPAQPTVDLRGDTAPVEETMPGLMPEGVFVVRQFGTMRLVGAAGWVFIFAPNSDGPTLPPMPLLPSANLQAMEQIAAPSAEAGRDAGFLVSGQVFVFEGRNYLLPTIFVQADGPDPVAREEAAEDETAPAEPPAGMDPFDVDAQNPDAPEPSVDELLRRIEEASQRAPTGDVSAQFAPNPAGLAPEGALVASRRGRLLRSESGGWKFVPDVDADTPVGVDQPMDLLPCRALEAMLAEQALLGQRPFVVSGRVFIYNGRNYLLPTMFVIERRDASGLSTAQ
ncbi:MAG: hypothetical protein ACF8QF_05610 [Phycisphaerales bacterium]